MNNIQHTVICIALGQATKFMSYRNCIPWIIIEHNLNVFRGIVEAVSRVLVSVDPAGQLTAWLPASPAQQAGGL